MITSTVSILIRIKLYNPTGTIIVTHNSPSFSEYFRAMNRGAGGTNHQYKIRTIVSKQGSIIKIPF